METRDEKGKWLPGRSPNPSGRPPVSAEERLMRENFQKAFAMLGNKSITEIQEIAKDPSQPAPYAIAAKALDWAFRKGNPAMYREIFDRTIGKAVDIIQLEGHMKIDPYDGWTIEQIEQRIREVIEEKTKLIGTTKV